MASHLKGERGQYFTNRLVVNMMVKMANPWTRLYLFLEVIMKQISNKEYEKYQQYQTDKLHGRILTPDGLRVICAGLDNDPEKIGKHMLEMLAKFRNEGIVE